MSTPGDLKIHYGRVGHLRDSDGFIGDDSEAFTVTCGSNGSVTATGGKTFSKRTLRDLVTGVGLSGETVIVAIDSPTTEPLATKRKRRSRW